MKNLHVVTENNGKFEEISLFCGTHLPSLKIIQSSLSLVEVQSNDLLEIAMDKARQAWSVLKKPLIVEDTGFFFEKYSNFPGALTKFVYQGIGLEGLLKLVRPGDRAYCSVYLVYIDGPERVQNFIGTCNGTIVIPNEHLGHAQLPYANLFLPDGSEKTYAQLRGTPAFENYSARLKALHQFVNWYKASQ